MSVRIEYDDNQIDVIDKINRELKEIGFELVDDGQDHDGFIVLEIVDHTVINN